MEPTKMADVGYGRTSLDARGRALVVAREAQGTCGRVVLPARPAALKHVTAEQLEMRKAEPAYPELRASWLRWASALSGAAHENERRLRGAQWAVRELRRHDDPEARAALAELERFLVAVWGVEAPDGIAEASRLASETVQSMVRHSARAT